MFKKGLKITYGKPYNVKDDLEIENKKSKKGINKIYKTKVSKIDTFILK